MRVIAGKARGCRLKRVPGDTTRPIMDRVKESLFNILGMAEVMDRRWLDLFGGTGQVGIEALSRGAQQVVFVDNARAAIRTIHANLATTRLAAQADVVQTDAFAYLQRPNLAKFDLIYVAPPQYKNLWLDVLRVLDERPLRWLHPQGLVVVQIDPKEYEPPVLAHLTLYDERKYGNTLLLFYEIGDG